MFRTILYRIVLPMAIALFVVQPAHAYLDPGSGSVLLQSIVAAVFGAAFFVKLNWQKLKSGFKRRLSGARSTDDPE